MPLSSSNIRILKDDEGIRVQYMAVTAEFRLNPDKPIEVLNSATDAYDETVVEVIDPTMVAIRQFGEDGQVHTICLSPAMAIELIKLSNSFLFFPEGITPPTSQEQAA